MASYFRAHHLTLHPSVCLGSYFLANHSTLHPFIGLASYFRADHLTFHPSIPLVSYFHSLGELFSCRPFNSPSFGEFSFCADHITLHQSIILKSYFCAVHPLGELFSCRPSIVLSVYNFGELNLCHPSPGESYFGTDHLILQSLASYFGADHITAHPFILLASYFCAVHPLVELFSCLPFNSPSFGQLFFVPII